MIITVVLLGLAAACSLFEQDVEVLQTFELRIDQPADAALQFSVQKDIDTNTEVAQKYAREMNSLVIKKISYKVKDFNGSDDPSIYGQLEFAPSGSSEYIMLSPISGLRLKEMAEQEEESAIVLPDRSVEEKLTQLLKSGRPVTFRLNAVTNNQPIAATLVVNIDSKITVEI